MKNNDSLPARVRFPIVGIGASAGGLVALEQFISQVPVQSGMAYVIVSHLDPTRESLMVELLQRQTAIPIVEAHDQMQVEPNHVYVIPPGHDLSLLHGCLHLLVPGEPRGLRLPIDFFFKSLADDQQQSSIGVILSGMGSDGTVGLRAIRQAAGACFVQAPATAQFDSMPRSAIDAGVADVVAPVAELPAKILSYVARIQIGAQGDVEAEPKPNDVASLDKVIILLRAQSGHDFSLYKKSTIARRIERRMGLHELARIGDYLRYLRENPQESELLFNELLIGVTSFFRDAAVWEQLKVDVLPVLLASHPEGTTLRAWTAGCSTGEEAYSLAMIFKEVMDEREPAQRVKLQIFASDLDKSAIDAGRAGVYSQSIAADVSEQRINRFFVEDPAGYRVCNEIREMVVFAEQNIVVDPPFSKIDLVTCRNLLIYLEPELQGKLLQLFHHCLNPGGFLLLGNSESLGTSAGLFSALAGNTRIYRRLDTPLRTLPMDFPAAFVRASARWSEVATLAPEALPPAPNLQMQVERIVLERYAPAAILVTPQGELLYFSGKTGKYLEPAAGRPSLNLFAMAREGLNQALSEVFHRAVREKTPATVKKVKIIGNGATHYVDVMVHPLEEPPALSGTVLIVFNDVAMPHRRKSRAGLDDRAAGETRMEDLVLEIQQSRLEAKSTREQMQTSQEQLESTNEELQSANEELQSTIEELTTSKEEMQSMNEELLTVNRELQAKVAELSRTSNDMKNLLESTEIATLFLDDELHVRGFTAQTTQVIKLIPGDRGRLISDIVSDLNYPEMAQHAQEVLRTLVFQERDVPTTDGRWYRVRIMPYRTQEKRIDGLVITFLDITLSKKLEAQLRATQAQCQSPVEKSKSQGVGHGLS